MSKMQPWVGVVATGFTGSMIIGRGHMRGGAAMFWTYVGGAMLASRYIAPRHTLQIGAATSALVMYQYEYIHPFGIGPNPLKHGSNVPMHKWV